MQKVLFTLVMIIMSGLIFSGQALAGTFDQRQVRIRHGINGINNDQLTRHEAQGLKQERRQMHRQKQSYLHDEQLTHKERHRLNRSLDRAEQQIRQLKQNSSRRNPYLQPYRRYTEPNRRLSDPYRRYWQ